VSYGLIVLQTSRRLFGVTLGFRDQLCCILQLLLLVGVHYRHRRQVGGRWKVGGDRFLTAPPTPFWEDNIKTQVKDTMSGLCKVVKRVVMYSGRWSFLKKLEIS